jgi:protein ImuA
MPRALSLDTPYVRFAPQINQVAGDGAAFRRAISFGLEALDGQLKGGGLPFGAHQIAGSPGDDASAMLFALLAAGRRLSADPRAQVLVVQERAALAEGGDLYGQGLHALGLDVARIVLLGARDGAQALRMTDEAIRSGAAAVVVAELHRAGPRIDLSATRRFNLFGRGTDTLALLVTPDLEGTSAAMTRWRVRAASSQAARRFVGPPVLDLELTRNRLGPVGRFTVEWSSENAQFRSRAATPICAPVVPAPFDRQGEGGVFAPGGGADSQERIAAYGGQ